MKLLALVSDSGTAMAETALCARCWHGQHWDREHLARTEVDFSGNNKWHDVTTNDAVECTECGHKVEPLADLLERRISEAFPKSGTGPQTLYAKIATEQAILVIDDLLEEISDEIIYIRDTAPIAKQSCGERWQSGMERAASQVRSHLVTRRRI